MARELGLGGTERQLAEIALALDRVQFEPHVGCFTDGGFRARELRAAGVPILELAVRSLVSRSALGGARRPCKSRCSVSHLPGRIGMGHVAVTSCARLTSRCSWSAAAASSQSF